MAAYVPVLGAAIIAPGITEDDSLTQILHWIGFRTVVQRTAIINDCFGSFADLKMLSEKDITAMASTFSSARNAADRILFGTTRTKYLKAIIHWIQDFYRTSRTPDIVGLTETTFKSHLERALSRANIRHTLGEQASTASSVANPGPLKNEKMWKEWEEKFENYTRCSIGSNGIPLNYVIRENDAPDHTTIHPDFVTETIACAPLNGEYYDADKLSVFNMLVSFTTGQPSGDWIKNTVKFADGRRSMAALRAHFAGEGNATRNVAEADRLKESLHYKSEKAMAFETFLTQMQKMFNIYETEGEPINEDQKIRLLFKKIQHKDLEPAISALQTQQTLGQAITYTMCANHLSARVSELPEFIIKNRNISGVNSVKGSGDGGDKSGIYNSDGSIRTGFISNWKDLSDADKELVKQERQKKKSGKGHGASSRKGGDHKQAKSQLNTINQLKASNLKFKRQIKALKRVSFEDDDHNSAASNTSEDFDAGDQFGGKNAKKQSKEKKRSKK